MNTRNLRAAAACALLATTSLTLPAVARAATPAPKFVDTIDDHGVDLANGLPFFSIEEGGIGSGPGRVAMQRIWAEGGGFLDNWSGGLEASGSQMFVEFGGISQSFSGSGTTWTADKADGSTLTVDAQGYWIYTGRDGTQIKFDNSSFSEDGHFCPGSDSGSCHIPQSITRPDGMKFTLTWNTARLCTQPIGVDCGQWMIYKRLASVTSSAGYKFTIAYLTDVPGSGTEPQANWYLRSTVTFDNNANHPPAPLPAISYAYPDGNTTQVTDPGARTWTFTTDASGRLTGVKRPGSASNNISYAYGADGTVNSSTKDGVTNSYSRSVVGATATETLTNPLSQQTVVVSDTTKGRPTSVKDGLNRTTAYAYDANARLTQITAPEGNNVQYAYDARGNVTTTTSVAKVGSGLSNIITSASFDLTCANVVKCNKPNSTTDAKGNVIDYTYDVTHGGVLTVTQPAPSTGGVRPQTRYSYAQVNSASGDLVYMLTKVAACQTLASCSGAVDETEVVAAYNSNLLPTTVTRQSGDLALVATSTLTYNPSGTLSTVDGPLSGTADTSRYAYDNVDQLTQVTSPDPDGAGTLPNRAIKLTYRGDGQVSKQELGTAASDGSGFTALQTVDITFDSNNRPVTSKLSASGTDYALTQTSYDALGRVDCSAVRMNIAAFGSLPASACTLSTQGSDGPDRISQNVYDAAGEVTQLKVGVGTSDAATERTLTYSNNGQVSSLKDGENNLTTYIYDGFDRPKEVDYPNPTKGSGTSNTADKEQYTYDANSNVTQVTLRDAHGIVFTYDKLDRVATKASGQLPGTTYTYDLLGRPLTIYYTSGGGTVTNSFDALGRLTSSSSDSGGTAHPMSYQYDLAGRRTRVTWWDGFYVDYDRLVTGEISKVRENGATTGVGVLASYAYDNLGNRTSLTFGNGASEAFTYDPVSRLASLSNDLSGTANDLTATFNYNPASQIASTVRTGDAYAFTGLTSGTTNTTTNGLNQQVTIGGGTATYDALGNLASDPTTSNTYSYNVENKLKTAVAGGVSRTLSYDPLNRLNVYNPGTLRRFVYDGAEAAAELDTAGAIQNRYVMGDAPDEVLVDYAGSGTTSRRFLGTDERGSVISLTDSSGALIGINTYDEYGKPGASNTGRFQYTGQRWLSELGAYDYKARVYLPHLGVFAQTDPIGQQVSPNLYAYVGDDPINFTDPLGLEDLTITHAGCRGGTFHDGICIPNVGPGITPPTNVGTPIIVTGVRKPKTPTPAPKPKPNPKPQPLLPLVLAAAPDNNGNRSNVQCPDMSTYVPGFAPVCSVTKLPPLPHWACVALVVGGGFVIIDVLPEGTPIIVRGVVAGGTGGLADLCPANS